VFITDTHGERLLQAFSGNPDMIQLINMQESLP
jgi:hypothetical protein